MIKNENSCIDLAFELVAEFEGFVDHVYECAAGKQTIGYGSVVEYLPQKIQDKIKKEKHITKEEAENIAKDFLRNLLKNLEIKYPYLEEHQMAAILDLYYNVGIGNINRSNLPIFLQKQEWNKAIQSILSFCHYRDKNGIMQVAKGLQRRRQKEVDLFKTALDKLYPL